MSRSADGLDDGARRFAGRDGYFWQYQNGKVSRSNDKIGEPSDDVILERARSLANQTANAIYVQIERCNATAEDPWQTLYDAQFLIEALWRFRRAVAIAKSVRAASPDVVLLVENFDAALPGLRRMRNVLEHVDDYAIDAQHFGKNRRGDKGVFRAQVQVGGVLDDDGNITWVGETVNTRSARDAVMACYRGLKDIQAR